MTWLTNQNCHFGVLGKFPAVLFVALALLLDEEVQAEISAEAAAVALNSPAPLSSLRRAGPSCMFRVSIASSTIGSTFSFMWTSMELSRDTHCPEADPLGDSVFRRISERSRGAGGKRFRSPARVFVRHGISLIRGRYRDRPKSDGTP